MKITPLAERTSEYLDEVFGITIEPTPYGVWFRAVDSDPYQCAFVTSTALECVLDDIKVLKEEAGDE